MTPEETEELKRRQLIELRNKQSPGSVKFAGLMIYIIAALVGLFGLLFLFNGLTDGSIIILLIGIVLLGICFYMAYWVHSKMP